MPAGCGSALDFPGPWGLGWLLNQVRRESREADERWVSAETVACAFLS